MMTELERYAADLRNADPVDEQTFLALLLRGYHLLSLTDKDLAKEFSASRPTLTRWRNGNSAPHPAARRSVYAYLERMARVAARGACR